MSACKSCLQIHCCCSNKGSVTSEHVPLFDDTCEFGIGIRNNVTVEIGEGCKLLSMRPAERNEVFLCDPCPAQPNIEPSTVNLYDKGYEDAKAQYLDSGYADGYLKGFEDGKQVGKTEGRALGYAEGESDGISDGIEAGRDEVDCSSEYNKGYNKGLEDGQDSRPTEVGDIIDSITEQPTKYINFKDTSGSDVYVTVSQNNQGEWVSDNEDLVSVNAVNGDIKILTSNLDLEYGVTISNTPPETDNVTDEVVVYPDYTGLGVDDSFNMLIHASPTLVENIEKALEEGWEFVFNEDEESGGSFANRGTMLITVSQKKLESPKHFFKTIAHEVGHAVYEFTPYATDTRDNFIDAGLRDEGFASIHYQKCVLEAETNLSMDIMLDGLEPMREIYNMYGDTEQGYYEMGEYIGDNKVTSTTGQNYRDYYGSFYDTYYG